MAKKQVKAKTRTRKIAGKAKKKKTRAKVSSREGERKGAGGRRSARNTAPQVRVRMYRQGLGDCFLLTFDQDGAAGKRHVLIDCGTLGAKTTGVGMKEVVENIRATTGGKLDLLITTHEHLDHVSGFRDRRKVFEEEFTVARVWQTWTENPEDELAQDLAKYKHDLGVALAGVLQAPGAADAVPEVVDLLGFFGDDHLLGAGRFAKTVNEAMEFVRAGLGAKTTYLKPSSTPIEPDWLPGFRFYVLGPPRNEKLLKDTGEHGSGELYGLEAAGKSAAAHFAHASAGAEVGEDAMAEALSDERDMPFDRRFRCRPREAPACFREYFAREHEWRCIDREYLRMASELALQLDSITNNTSLALAIERIADGKVLLFPGDAQQGSWLSWHDVEWHVKDEQGSHRTVTIRDLLSQTVFYKVGHHGSHNATAKGKGLEMMTRQEDLTAFIPVDRGIALSRNPKGSWKMPAVPLYRRLLERCNGRVLRSDLGWAAEPSKKSDAIEGAFEKLASADEWKKWKQAQDAAKNVDTGNRLYFDYLLA